MDQVVRGTNRNYVVDFIPLLITPKLINSDEIKYLYENEKLSLGQIAEKFGVTKSVILNRLRQMRVDTEKGRSRQSNPDNYRKAKPPYGYQVKDGKLVLNKSELKVCRIVVEMVGRQNKSARGTARELMQRGFKNRQGDVSWGHLVVQQIFKRWNGKI